MNVSDRILVMYEGEIVGEFDPKTTTVEEIGMYMAGAKRQKLSSGPSSTEVTSDRGQTEQAEANSGAKKGGDDQ